MIFYNNWKTAVYKVIRSVIYLFIYNLICLEYLCILQQKLSSYNKKFEENKFNDLYGFCIPVIVSNIMSCHSFQ